jgi:hypothetical protein
VIRVPVREADQLAFPRGITHFVQPGSVGTVGTFTGSFAGEVRASSGCIHDFDVTHS